MGMVYATPPIRWLDGQTAAQRASLVEALVEIELLAVAADHRGRGVGNCLLDAAQVAAREAGTRKRRQEVTVGRRRSRVLRSRSVMPLHTPNAMRWSRA
ncbi:Acetyltransferase (GNAT) family protein [Actinacidiphila yanglinensis]|uniref:Acetyltransferase (GNAT) family protein n=2 Tax=Actinacidiphila yanglinensis TaxID=310779 RepID=A0A1H6E1E0_9ACTN|nr:Acetyltransferase (GNAT) family protein [Actinacidiphila yanglinensis]SEG90994.1 Acetyltransferase (GNAT) family protein [Actinacidiphila yanglinensis]